MRYDKKDCNVSNKILATLQIILHETRFLLSCMWSPAVGSSRIKRTPVRSDPNWLAMRIRCNSPLERVLIGRLRVR